MKFFNYYLEEHNIWNFTLLYDYRSYKNKVKETPGWNEEVLMWCRNAAQENGLKAGDYMGGFAIDEMKIQVALKSKSMQLRYRLNYNKLGEEISSFLSNLSLGEPKDDLRRWQA